MPFAIWCSTCPKETIIGQGVRFNAEKKKVGNYYSSPIYSFRMKHPACGGWIEIRTDPKNTAYVVTEGATKRDTGEDIFREGDIELRSEAEKERLRNDAFAALEVTIDDRQQATVDKSRINELWQSKDRDWDDTWAANQKLRKTFRAEREVREKKHMAAEELKDRMALGVDLLDEFMEDRRRAALVEFGETDDGPMLPAQVTGHTSIRGELPLKADIVAANTKKKLQVDLARNTRNAVDPFLTPSSNVASTTIGGLKRKREKSPGNAHTEETKLSSTERKGTQLVTYDSD